MHFIPTKRKLKAFAHSLLGQGTYTRYLGFLLNQRSRFSALFSNSVLLSWFYYSFFDYAVNGEKYATLRGIAQFNKNKNNIALLRRNVHRLEKGMIMVPRRDCFAADYILETVKLFNRCGNTSLPTRKWASDVLEEYFSIVSLDSYQIKQAKDLFYNEETQKKELTNIPFERDTKIIVDYNLMKQICEKRKSVRWYKEEIVEVGKIEKAVEIALLAPSACNRQPFEFHYTNEPLKAKEIASLAMGTSGFRHNIQCIIAVVGDLSCFNMAHDRHVIYIDSSLATMQLMLGLESLGLSSCALNWPDIKARNKKLSNLLNIPEYKRVIMLLSVGYEKSGTLVPYSTKKSINETLFEVK
jgi:nitroreductase